MKNDYTNGGMKVTDIDCLNKALKLKQFIRSSNTNHPISKIQRYESYNVRSCLQQEYHRISEDEPICQSAQQTLNTIIDYNRQEYTNMEDGKYESDKNLIEEVASINIITYLKRKQKTFHLCMMKEITNLGISTLGELVQALECVNDRKTEKIMNLIAGTFPKVLQNISKCFNEDVNSDLHDLQYLLINNDRRLNINEITTKDLQNTLKIVLKKLEKQDFCTKLKAEHFEDKNIMIFRNSCQNSKLRNIYFRLINNDFYTREKMFKFKMVEDCNCTRCGRTETTKHLLFECQHSKVI
jgi:hypothetical protein